jgi:transcriptional regulator with XRE-family HTH domain
LGETIRDTRLSLGLTLRQAAAAVGMAHSSLARLESGQHESTSPDRLQRLARLLEIDARDLFALAGIEAPEGLPSFAPYLRAKYGMREDLIQQLAGHFDYLAAEHSIRPKDRPAKNKAA